MALILAITPTRYIACSTGIGLHAATALVFLHGAIAPFPLARTAIAAVVLVPIMPVLALPFELLAVPPLAVTPVLLLPLLFLPRLAMIGPRLLILRPLLGMYGLRIQIGIGIDLQEWARRRYGGIWRRVMATGFSPD